MSLWKCDSVRKGEVCSCALGRKWRRLFMFSSGKLRSHVFQVEIEEVCPCVSGEKWRSYAFQMGMNTFLYMGNEYILFMCYWWKMEFLHVSGRKWRSFSKCFWWETQNFVHMLLVGNEEKKFVHLFLVGNEKVCSSISIFFNAQFGAFWYNIIMGHTFYLVFLLRELM